MKIAFVSAEFSGSSSGGGIGTYVRNISTALEQAGHEVHVFTREVSGNQAPKDIQIHLVPGDQKSFSSSASNLFRAEHFRRNFDLVESAEFLSEGLQIFEEFPEVARVVKLHTASYQIEEINHEYVSPLAVLRFRLGALRRGRWPRSYRIPYDRTCDSEFVIASIADEVTSPSASLIDIALKNWQLDPTRCEIVPNPFEPSPELLALPISRGATNVLFLGRIEVRKGVLDLAKAIRQVFNRHPDQNFQLVGRILNRPGSNEPLDSVMVQIAGPKASKNMQFIGGVAYSNVFNHLRDAKIVVLPSYWENFPYVCLEAMSAGCAVVASSAGGMAEMIEDEKSGILVPPRNPQALARAISKLIENPNLCRQMGALARSRVLDQYSFNRIGELQLQSYQRAIERSKSRVGAPSRGL